MNRPFVTKNWGLHSWIQSFGKIRKTIDKTKKLEIRVVVLLNNSLNIFCKYLLDLPLPFTGKMRLVKDSQNKEKGFLKRCSKKENRISRLTQLLVVDSNMHSDNNRKITLF